MKLRFGLDCEAELRASLTIKAESILNKVASLKKNLDEEAANLITETRGEPDLEKKKGNLLILLILFLPTLFFSYYHTLYFVIIPHTK